MQPYAQPRVNDPDSPDNKNTQSRKNDTQQDDEQDDIKRWRLTEDKEFSGAREQIKERLSDREIPHDKEVQAGEKKVRFPAVRVGRLRLESHVSRLAFAPRVVEPARA